MLVQSYMYLDHLHVYFDCLSTNYSNTSNSAKINGAKYPHQEQLIYSTTHSCRQFDPTNMIY